MLYVPVALWLLMLAIFRFISLKPLQIRGARFLFGVIHNLRYVAGAGVVNVDSADMKRY
jgi:hypothetical protein